MSKINVAEEIVFAFGGQAALARALGHTNMTTVQGWCKRGVVPLRQIPPVLAAARRLKVKLRLVDFFRGELKARK